MQQRYRRWLRQTEEDQLNLTDNMALRSAFKLIYHLVVFRVVAGEVIPADLKQVAQSSLDRKMSPVDLWRRAVVNCQTAKSCCTMWPWDWGDAMVFAWQLKHEYDDGKAGSYEESKCRQTNTEFCLTEETSMDCSCFETWRPLWNCERTNEIKKTHKTNKQ